MGEDSKDRRDLGEGSLAPLMARLAAPAIAAQVANLLYSLIDRVLIGHIPGVGADALAGMGACMPVITLVSSFAVLAAAGGAPLASMELGRGDRAQAQRITFTAQMLLLGFTVLLMVACYVLMGPMVGLFGASATTAPYAVAYLRIYLLGTAFVMVETGMGMFLLAQGDSGKLLAATAVGAALHVLLAILFIFPLGWGMEGAAAASVASQGACAAMVAFYLRRPDSPLRLEWRAAVPDRALSVRILSVGSGRFFVVATEALLLVVVNSTLLRVGGDAYVGAMAVLFSVQAMVYALVQGFTQGTQPIVSFCYGAGDRARARAAARAIVAVSFLATLALALLVMAFPHQVAVAFTDDAQMAALVAGYASVFFAGFVVFGLQLGMQAVFMGLGKGMCSLAVAAFRKLAVFIPLVLALSGAMGADGVVLAEPISDAASAAFCAVLFAATVPRTLRDGESAR